MKSKRNMIITIAVMVVLAGIACLGLIRDFDAQGYVRAVLDQTFQGEVKDAAEIMDGADEDELYAQYEKGIDKFVAGNITGGVPMEEEMTKEYTALCKEIFGAMKYNVSEAEKINRKEYDVKVEFQPADVFPKFMEAVGGISGKLKEKTELGEYKGTKEEIDAQMKKEFLDESYKALKAACENMQYGEKQTIVFKVKSDEGSVFSVEENDVSALITKILRLDEIQD